MSVSTLQPPNVKPLSVGSTASYHRALRKKYLVTVVIMPLEKYSTLPDAVKMLYQHADLPFKLVVLESDAPESIRYQLEKITKGQRRNKIIYTNHCPVIGEMVNLAVPHIQTPYALFMSGDCRLMPKSLSRLVKHAEETRAGLVLPEIVSSSENGLNNGYRYDEAALRGISSLQVEAFLASRTALVELGEWQNEIDINTLKMDLSLRAELKGIRIEIARNALVRSANDAPVKPMDAKVFDTQWKIDRAQDSLRYMKKKWNIDLNEKAYLEWVKRKQTNLVESKSFFVLGDLLQNSIASPLRKAERNVRKLLEPLLRS